MPNSVASTLVWRIETVSEDALASRLRHVRGQARSAKTREFQAQGIDLCELAHGVKYGVRTFGKRNQASAGQLRKLRAEARELLKRQRGVKPELWCELVAVGGKVVDWHPDKAQEWVGDLMKEVRRIMPETTVVASALHGDETEWHVHVAMHPRARDSKGRLRVGLTAMRRQCDAIITNSPVKDRINLQQRRMGSSELLNHLHNTVGVKHGLARGAVNQPGKHEDVDPLQAGLSRVREVSRLASRMKEQIQVVQQKGEKADDLIARYGAIDQAEKEFEAKARRREAKRDAEWKAKRYELNAAFESHTDKVAALEAERQELDERREADKEAAIAAGNAAGEARFKALKTTIASQIAALNERAASLKKIAAKQRREDGITKALRRKAQLGLDVLEVCIYENMDLERTKDALYAAKNGIELDPALMEKVERVRQARRMREGPTVSKDGLGKGAEAVMSDATHVGSDRGR